MTGNALDFEKVCRFCGLEKPDGKFIFSFEAAKTGLLSKIKCLFPEEAELMNVKAVLPKFICSTCETTINYFQEFRSSVKLVQQTLHKKIIVQKTCSSDVTQEKREHVCPVVPKETTVVIRFDARGSMTCNNCNANLLTNEVVFAGASSIGVCSDCGYKDKAQKFLANKASSSRCPKCLYMKKKRPVLKHAEVAKKAFQCDVCKKSFGSKGHLNRHCLTHFGTKPFKCQDCGTSFTQKSTLKTHMLIHEKTNPFACKWCGQQFRIKQTMANHVMSIHGVVSEVSNLYECDKCKKKFVHKDKLRRHYRSHSGEKPFKCDLCEKTFTQRINLKTHYKKHESESQFSRVPPIHDVGGSAEADIGASLVAAESEPQFDLLGDAKRDNGYPSLSPDVLGGAKEDGPQFATITQTLNDTDQGELIQELLSFERIPAESDPLEPFTMVENEFRETNDNDEMKSGASDANDMYYNMSSSSYMIYSSNSVLYELGDGAESAALPTFSRLNTVPKHELSL